MIIEEFIKNAKYKKYYEINVKSGVVRQSNIIAEYTKDELKQKYSKGNSVYEVKIVEEDCDEILNESNVYFYVFKDEIKNEILNLCFECDNYLSPSEKEKENDEQLDFN